MPTRSNHLSDSKEAEEMFMKIAKAHEALTDQVYPHKRGHLLALGVWCEPTSVRHFVRCFHNHSHDASRFIGFNQQYEDVGNTRWQESKNSSRHRPALSVHEPRQPHIDFSGISSRHCHTGASGTSLCVLWRCV